MSTKLDLKVVRWLPLLLALVLCGYATLYQCFTDRLIYFDEVGLYNPVYMYLHYGKMTYPAHGEFDAMFVHPPTHYFLIATLMRTGLSVYHAAGLLSVLLFAAFAALIITSRFDFPIQIGFLFGGFLGAFIWAEALVLRPDLTLALCWAGGLVALETARLDNWNRPRLAIGGFLLALASGVHYTGILAGGGLLVYAIKLVRQLGRKRAMAPLAWMTAGAVVYAVPDLVLFVIPHLKDIVAFSLSVQKNAPPGNAFQHHMQSYAVWAQDVPKSLHLRPFTTLLTAPLFLWYIPAALVGPLLLFFLPSTRVLALAALPQVLFILFGTRHKQVGYTGYLIPEMMLYLIAITSILFSGAWAIVRRFQRAWPTALVAVSICTAAAVVAATEIPALVVQQVVKTPGLYDFEAGHAAGRSILGKDGVVGTTSAGVWYTSGATNLYFITPDIIYPNDVQCVDLKKYFATFDALAADPQESWVSYNRQRKNVISSYVDHLLQLRGFFFGDRRDYYESGVSYMLYSSERPKPLVGFGVKGQSVFRFEERAGGDHVFLAAVCPTSFEEAYGPLNNAALKLDFYATLYLPIPTNEDPRLVKDHRLKAAVIHLIADRQRFDREISKSLQSCAVRDEISGVLTKSDLQSFIHASERDDQTIHFYKNYQELRTAAVQLPRHKESVQDLEVPRLCAPPPPTPLPKNTSIASTSPPAGMTLSMPSALRLDLFTPASDKTTVVGKSPVLVTTAPEQWSYAAKAPILIDRVPGSKRFVHLRGRVLKGQIGLGIYNRSTNSFQREEFLDPSPVSEDYYFSIPSPDKADDLMLRNTSGEGGPSQIAIDSTEILARGHKMQDLARLEDVTLAYNKASIQRNRSVTITTAPEQWSFAAAIPVQGTWDEQGVTLRIRARVVSGKIGFGLLSDDRKSFLIEQYYGESESPIEIFLPLPSSGGLRNLIVRRLRNLIIRNVAPNGVPSIVTVDGIETWKLE